MSSDPRDSAHVHWLLLGPLSETPSGRRFVVDRDGLAAAFAAVPLTVDLDLGPALGAGRAVAQSFSFSSLEHYTLKHQLTALPLLADLRQLADALGGPSSRRPTAQAAIERIVELIGDGPLASELRATFADPPATAADAAPVQQGAELVEAMLEAGSSAGSSERSASARAVDSFISAVRRGSKAKQGSSSRPAHRRARELIETAVFGAVRAVLAEPQVRANEACWRGLGLVARQVSGHASIFVELVDVARGDLAATIRACESDEAMHRPDAFFVFDALADPELLLELARAGEELLAPVIAALSPELFGTADFEAMSQALRTARPDPSALLGERAPAFLELRSDESSRWLGLVINDVVVAAEGAGAARRSVEASAAFALAAMLSASFRDTGGFARILGKSGALQAPGMREVEAGREAGISVPTASFLSIRAQAELAGLGIIGLGSGRNTDRVALSEVPTARHARDAVLLPAQILTGRLVRFASWVRDQVPTGSSDSEVIELFQQAATVFLFPGLSSGARLDVGVVDEGHGPMVRLVASVDPSLASMPFEVGFDLPLRRASDSAGE